MNEQLAQALKNFHEATKKESADDVVSVNVFFNSQWKLILEIISR